MERLERPPFLRTPTWKWLLGRLEQLDDEALVPALRRCGYRVGLPLDREEAYLEIADRPGPMMVERGIFERPDLLALTALRLPDGEPAIIDAQTAGFLARGDVVVPVPLRDGGERQVRRGDIEAALTSGAPIDQLERRKMPRLAFALEDEE